MNKLMSFGARQEMLASIQQNYKEADAKLKKKILEGFVAATRYDRKHAIKLLNNKFVHPTKKKKRGRPPKYDEAVVKVLEMLWDVGNQICSKRLVPFIPDLITSLEQHGHLHLTKEIKELVLSVSPATFDRLLRCERIKNGRGLTTTKAGTLLKNHITIRTFADWNEQIPGFFECDLVAHCGETTMGIFLNTLVVTDIITTWTECIALFKKSANDVILGLDTSRKLLPFAMLGLDVDNGSEFINYDLFDYCKENSITFTRSRPYKKNDQAHVEQKNGSIVRRLVGYDRYEGEAAWEVMCELYSILRLYINFFQPTLKLIDKVRIGSKTIKKYDKAKTPYQRVLVCEHIAQETKNKLIEQYKKLDPIALKIKLSALQKKLWALSWNQDIKTADEINSAKTDITLLPSEAKFYRKTKKPSRPHDWKTRTHPLDKVMDFVELEIKLNPNTDAKIILKKLMEKYPDEFCKSHLRTLQRHVGKFRAKESRREKKYQELMVNNKNMTTATLRAII